MIERIDSNLSTFKSLTFTPGMNVVLATKSVGATDRQTRNGAGKSSLVELVHFLLGGNYTKEHFLHAPALVDSRYGIRFALAGKSVAVERSPSNAKDVVVLHADTSSWPRAPKINKKSNELTISNTHWRVVLGNQMFQLLDDDEDEGDEEREPSRFGATFRMLFSYFARRQNAGGFLHPQQSSTVQQPWDQQVSLTCLLGLDASVPQSFQQVRQRERALAELRKAAKGGALGAVIGKASDLRTKLTIQDAKVAKQREQLSTFQVVPQYRELEQEASRLGNEIATLSNGNTSDEQTIQFLNDAVQTEAPPRWADVRKAYEELGLVLPGSVKQRFEDVERFHKSVVDNRRSHLRSEIEAAHERIRAREQQKEALGARRAQVMMILKTGGALEHFSRLQGELSKQEAIAESLRTQFEAAENLERNSTELSVERARLHKLLQDNHHEQKPAIDDAILVFEELSNALYEQAGSLTVSDTENGPTFEVKIEASRSKGINNMQIFCFDMMLMELCIRRGIGPRFLIHDSHLFDGVDERQVARALEIGAARAEKLGFQYIVTLNDDAVPRKVMSAGFPFDSYINPVRLTDATDVGGLFGLRFE